MVEADAGDSKDVWDYGVSLLRKHGRLHEVVDTLRSVLISRVNSSEQIKCYDELAGLGEGFGEEALDAYRIRNDMAPGKPSTLQAGQQLIDKYGSNHRVMCDLVGFLLKQRGDKRDLGLATQAALAANRAKNGQNAEALVLVATVFFEAGNMAEAVHYQTMAMEREALPENKAKLNKKLDYYRMKLEQPR